MAIDQKAPLGIHPPTMSWSRRPWTKKPRVTVPAATLGCSTTQLMTVETISAAQYGGRILQARRPMKRRVPPESVSPRRIGASDSENPDTTMNTATARWPYSIHPTHQGPILRGNAGQTDSQVWCRTTNIAAAPRTPSTQSTRRVFRAAFGTDVLVVDST